MQRNNSSENKEKIIKKFSKRNRGRQNSYQLQLQRNCGKNKFYLFEINYSLIVEFLHNHYFPVPTPRNCFYPKHTIVHFLFMLNQLTEILDKEKRQQTGQGEG